MGDRKRQSRETSSLRCAAGPYRERIVFHFVQRENGRQGRWHLVVAERIRVATGGVRMATFAMQGRRGGRAEVAGSWAFGGTPLALTETFLV